MPASRTRKRAHARKVATHAPDNAKVAGSVATVTGSHVPSGEDLLGSEELKRQFRDAKKR
jgi:hypothetical protein